MLPGTGLPPALVGLAVVVALATIALVSPGTSRLRTTVALAAAALLLVLPALADAPSLVRFALALGGLVVTLKAVDLSLRPIDAPLVRLAHVVVPIDVRSLAPHPRTLDTGALVRTVPWLLACVAAFQVGVFEANRHAPGPLYYMLRWGGSAAFTLAAFEVIALNLVVVTRLAGFDGPLVHDAPYKALSLREFWGRRWNRLVGGWIRAHVFEPLRAPLGPSRAVLAGFVASAFLHWYLTAVSLGFQPSLPMAGFFVIQGAALALEGRLGVSRWSPAAARAWTLGLMLACAPLFLEPMMQLMDPLFPREE